MQRKDGSWKISFSEKPTQKRAKKRRWELKHKFLRKTDTGLWSKIWLGITEWVNWKGNLGPTTRKLQTWTLSSNPYHKQSISNEPARFVVRVSTLGFGQTDAHGQGSRTRLFHVWSSHSIGTEWKASLMPSTKCVQCAPWLWFPGPDKAVISWSHKIMEKPDCTPPLWLSSLPRRLHHTSLWSFQLLCVQTSVHLSVDTRSMTTSW